MFFVNAFKLVISLAALVALLFGLFNYGDSMTLVEVMMVGVLALAAGAYFACSVIGTIEDMKQEEVPQRAWR